MTEPEPDAAIRIGVAGAAGRMGRAVCDAVNADPELVLVAGSGARSVGDWVAGIVVSSSSSVYADNRCDVVVDFTTADVARELIPRLVERGIHCVSGTTGLDDTDIGAIRTAADSGGGNVVLASNFSVSAVLMMRFAELAAPLFDTAEIIELHHDGKIDAPSGTAIVTAERLSAASDGWAEDPTKRTTIPGARGAAGPGGIPIHSVRMRGMVAHQEVILGTLGQTLTIRQDSYDRSSYMPGVLLAVKRVAGLGGLTIGLDSLLDV